MKIRQIHFTPVVTHYFIDRQKELSEDRYIRRMGDQRNDLTG